MTDDLFELQLQEELRQMFEVETQTYLQNYIVQVLQLNPTTWKTDIQEIYRAIHTIKGGAVTVGADAILYVAIALEDLLADLRYLEVAPPLADGQLGQYLTEAGELLTSTISTVSTREEAKQEVLPILERVEQLRTIIQQNYLPEWNSQKALHQEFAQQGFDLVILDLEIGLEKLQHGQPIADELIDIAELTIAQLQEIGINLKLASGWSQLLLECKTLLTNNSPELWLSQWPDYFQKLKTCVLNSGKLEVGAGLPRPYQTADRSQEIDLCFNFDEIQETINNLPLIELQESPSLESEITLDLAEISQLADNLESLKVSKPLLKFNLEDIAQAVDLIGTEPQIVAPSPTEIDVDLNIDWSAELASEPSPIQSLQKTAGEERNKLSTSANIQIPVSLSRADQTSQHLVDVLLSARMASGLYHSLAGQLTKLFSIASESVNYITRLRQIQDDYALMNDRELPTDSSGIALERYRQGYTTINRLLEISLRLSELGAEANKITTATQTSFQSLERNILNLEQSIEASRVISFKTLAFRAKAIVRDLINRYGKPAQLRVKGEDIELDAGITAKLEPALLHLIRNAYDHGLENPKERSKLLKPEIGTISLSLARQGSQYLLTISDDGAGIDSTKAAHTAIAKRLPLTNTQTPAELLAVLCQPGFSSKEAVSEISGRGVGMDVVANQVSSLNGKMSLETTLGKGSSFNIQFFTPRLLVPCILLHRSDRTFAIPIESVITSTLWSNLNLEETDSTLSYSWQVEQGGATVPGLDLLEYWLGRSFQHPISEAAIGICVGGSLNQQIWLLADDLGEQIDLLINPLPAPLVSPIGLLGVSLQINGTLVPVIDGADLAELLYTKTQNSQKLTTITAPVGGTPIELSEPEIAQMILVVDDAALMRRRIEASLAAYGHSIQTCTDGLEAWNWLQYNPTPALIITDLEMPNMDGFTLIERLRSQGATMPILVISSRLSEEWNQEAQRLGANGFLTKGFSTNDLINTVNSLI